ncbi:THUMP domain-containing protein [Limibacter armeniacum]|uniref:THUMP domain-containing class I SAM-dependent RNA methyltransferase n=1 Tax=Limibacter armeniacum TaxID=466084 RepID=UPI002FE60B56
MDKGYYELTAKTFFGLEDLLVEELKEIGAKDIKKGNRVVTFKGNDEVLYRANLWLRTALKILKPIAKFKAKDEEELYSQIKRIGWSKYMDNDGTLAIDTTVRSDVFTHSKYVALKAKDAIVDQFRGRTGVRPSVDVENPDLRLHIHMMGIDCILSLDSSGESLHRRGYRKLQKEAPLNEILAAGLIKMAGWHGQSNFVDPMCGSGTLPIEAAMIAMNIAPGMKRTFGFQKWKDYDVELWTRLLGEAFMKRKPFSHKIYASDISEDAIYVAEQNTRRAGVMDKVVYDESSIWNCKRPEGNGTMIINPPYGERIGDNVEDLYEQVGDKLKKDFDGFDAWIISSNREALKHVGLRPAKKLTVFNGGMECRYQHYEMYKGSKD